MSHDRTPGTDQVSSGRDGFTPRSAGSTSKGAGFTAAVLLSLVSFLSLPSCEFVDPTAPTEAMMSISANPLFIDINGEQSVITVIIAESDGTQVPDDTVVNFTTTLGSIPTRAHTRRGMARVVLSSGDRPGVASVTARSGTNEASIDVTVGAILRSIALSANPSTLGPGGGSTEITAVAFGDDGQPLAGVPITLSTDAGTLDSGGAVRFTNSQGELTDTLTTDETATVTATSGSVGDGVPVTATTTVEVSTNEPPQAQFVRSPTSPGVGQEVNFNAAGSTDDGSIVSFEWDFGDGSTGSGERVSHRYDAANTYTVLLVVTDDQGATASANQAVTVSLGQPPVASFTFSPTAPQAGQPVTFDASSSFDPDGSIVEYRWNWGDGTSPEVRQGPTRVHNFATSGTFTVRLTIRDDTGNTRTVSQTVQVS